MDQLCSCLERFKIRAQRVLMLFFLAGHDHHAERPRHRGFRCVQSRPWPRAGRLELPALWPHHWPPRAAAAQSHGCPTRHVALPPPAAVAARCCCPPCRATTMPLPLPSHRCTALLARLDAARTRPNHHRHAIYGTTERGPRRPQARVVG